eukprot:6206056-Pleurochrysis_carterae.AAC.5
MYVACEVQSGTRNDTIGLFMARGRLWCVEQYTSYRHFAFRQLHSGTAHRKRVRATTISDHSDVPGRASGQRKYEQAQ